MSLPSELKNMNVFADGLSYQGVAKSVTLPKLSRKMEEYRGGGMDGSVELDRGGELLTLEHSYAGLVPDLFSGFGAATVDASLVRFVGAHQDDDTGAYTTVEVVARGRHKEIDFGNQKAGDDTEHKFTTSCAYYKLTIAGVVKIEIDRLNMIFNVNGADRLAEQRAALGV